MDFSTRRQVMGAFFKTAYISAGSRAMALGLGIALAGCSGAQLADKLPQGAGGLPAETPARPVAASYQYPAVHDMPPPRATEPMTDAEQVRLEKDLVKARDRLEDKADQIDGAPKAAKKPAKPNARDTKTGETSGAAAKP